MVRWPPFCIETGTRVHKGLNCQTQLAKLTNWTMTAVLTSLDDLPFKEGNLQQDLVEITNPTLERLGPLSPITSFQKGSL